MFRNLRTSTKILLLCSMFMISIGITTYALVAEKRLAIDFAQKELAGTRFLTSLRGVYAAILTSQPEAVTAARSGALAQAISALEAAETEADGKMQTAEATGALLETLQRLSAAASEDGGQDRLAREALARAKTLAARIGDGSNLTLDPDLDSYYLQDIVVMKLPSLLGYLGTLETSLNGAAEVASSDELLTGSLILTTLAAIESNLAAAFRGQAESAMKPGLEAAFAKARSATTAYLEGVDADLARGDAAPVTVGVGASAYDEAVGAILDAWAGAHADLETLLMRRIDDLTWKMRRSLMVTGALVGLSILIAVMTHRHIVRPLERLENIAQTVRTTKDYSLRSDYVSRDEIGRLAAAFNDMLSELASAREREVASHAELARVTRLTAMGAMTASIAHEVNQPLAAIVTNSNAAIRWLANATPDLDEARAALKRIANDGHRASEVIGSIRALFKKDRSAATRFSLNDLVLEVLALVRSEMRTRDVSVRTELAPELPAVSGDRVQLQLVVVNLIVNAVEAMGAIPPDARHLVIRSSTAEPDRVLVAVEDTGAGIDPEDADRIFDAFYTTKPQGMGMGLAICRSIVEAHGGRLSVSPRKPGGSIFHLALPSAAMSPA